jgi:amino acid adenylation domain-containing protein
MLLDAIAARPDQPISRLPILTSAERRQVVVDWNQTATPYPRDHCIHTLFEEQARATPDAVALDFAGERLTYRELNLRANRLAHHLRGLGVETESLVGICLERSLELVVALVAVLKAGGAYVPLDPAYPDERLRFMAADCGLAVVITRAGLAPRLDLPGVRRVCLEDDADWVRAPIEEGPGTAVSPDNLAYVIYTSGSTGQPKGALIPHRGVVRLVKETRYVALNAGDTLLQFAPISFDASTFEIWGALLNGGRLAIFPPHIPTLEELGAFILEQQITTLWLTASLFQQMVDGPLDTLRQVRQLLAGGDVLPASAARRFLERFPGARLINGYGPTENTTFTCCHVMTQPDHAGSAVPIGRPISNTRVYLLDPYLEPVPIGVPGELFAGGDGLARGYLSRPDLTAERFVSDPFSTEQGARLYRTGDLARYRADGQIEFLGRMDQQVKIRGFRIELAEVEAALLGHPGVQEAVVVARQHADGDKYLVAYLVGLPDAPFADAAAPDHDGSRMVREFLRRRLPDFMVPARFVTLDALPLNPNGKVDRRALPEPDAERPAARSWTAPRTQVETTLAGMWSELLGVGRVGVDDHFFADLGGHSLRATQVVSRIREAFAVHLELRTIFEAPTVAELAEVIEDRLLREIEALDATEVRTLLGEGLAG